MKFHYPVISLPMEYALLVTVCKFGMFHTFLCIAPLKCLYELMYEPLMSHCGLRQMSCDGVKDELACYAKDYKINEL